MSMKEIFLKANCCEVYILINCKQTNFILFKCNDRRIDLLITYICNFHDVNSQPAKTLIGLIDPEREKLSNKLN